MLRKGNPYEGMTLEDFMRLCSSKEEIKQLKQFITKEYIKQFEVEA